MYFKAQSANVDPVELYHVRQTIRPEYERDAQRRYMEIRGREPAMNDVLDARYHTERLLHEWERIQQGDKKKGQKRDREER